MGVNSDAGSFLSTSFAGPRSLIATRHSVPREGTVRCRAQPTRRCWSMIKSSLAIQHPKAAVSSLIHPARRVHTAATDHGEYPLATVSQPVYSLATRGMDASRDTVNLVTYCAPMSINPRTVALGLYKGTQSWINFLDRRTGVLQVLRQEQAVLFEILGKTSAKQINKFDLLQDLGWGVKTELGHRVLEGCHGYLLLECMSGPVDAGDHDVVICKVTDYLEDPDTDSNLLYTADLRERGML